MQTAPSDILTRTIFDSLREEGFAIFGVTPALPLDEDIRRIKSWMENGRNGTMSFLERSIDTRRDISLFLEGARSVIMAGLPYRGDETEKTPDGAFFLARYARVRDYHTVISGKLSRVAGVIGEKAPGSRSAVFCDSSPVTEKAWAIRAGLGWRGRHSIVINESVGSFFFLGGIVTTAELEYNDQPAADRCGSCTLCTDSCPTSAICSDRSIDARRCIAYLTIEHKGDLPEELRGKAENIIFGCDRCQEVCPWNAASPGLLDDELRPSHRLADLSASEWQMITPEDFNELTADSPVRRTGYARMKRNIAFVSPPPSEKR